MNGMIYIAMCMHTTHPDRHKHLNTKIQVFWDMTLCHWASGSLRVRGWKCLGRRGSL